MSLLSKALQKGKDIFSKSSSALKSKVTDIGKTAAASSTTRSAMESSSIIVDAVKQTRAAKMTMGFGRGAKSASWNKVTKGIGKAMTNTKVAVGAGLVAGMGYGVASHTYNSIQEKQMMMQKKGGMSSNHLGTDGLTLALNYRRHKG